MASESDEEIIRESAARHGFKVLKGKVGSMNSSKVFAAIETAGKKKAL